MSHFVRSQSPRFIEILSIRSDHCKIIVLLFKTEPSHRFCLSVHALQRELKPSLLRDLSEIYVCASVDRERTLLHDNVSESTGSSTVARSALICRRSSMREHCKYVVLDVVRYLFRRVTNVRKTYVSLSVISDSASKSSRPVYFWK